MALKPTDRQFDVLDELAVRAIHGDRDAADAAMRVAAPLLAQLAQRLVREYNLTRNVEKEDVRADVDHGAARALAEYNPARGRAANWIVYVAARHARRASGGYFSTIGAARVAGWGGAKALDFEDPVFRGYTPLGEVDENGDAIEDRLSGVVGSERAEREERWRAAQRIGKMFRRLTPREREVVRRRFGLPPRPKDIGSYRRARRLGSSRAESYDEIAASMGLTGEWVRNILKRVIPQIGLENLPAPVPRNRLPIEP